tara:strand:+ start:442 stop:1983 length:1542 start_codon:yes stop_codon:yes gene_type:complete
MARLRQQHAQNYVSSSNVHTEFESIVRYLNSAERGNKTFGELFSKLFNTEGEVNLPVEFRLNTLTGIEARVGSGYAGEEGWTSVATLADVRGASGSNVGTIEGALFFNRQDIVSTADQTAFPYPLDVNMSSKALVFLNGILLQESLITLDYTNGNVVLSTAAALDDLVTIYSIRSQSVTNYRRLDFDVTSIRSQVPFSHTSDEEVVVYKNGILQRIGGSFDYNKDDTLDVITFTTDLVTGDVVNVLTVENSTVKNVQGIMLEEEYTTADGFINFSKVTVADEAIAQSKVVGLVSALATMGTVIVSETTPLNPLSGWLWVDISQAIPNLRFYQGTEWINTKEDVDLPSITIGDVNKYLAVNETADGYVYRQLDFTTVVPKTYMGAANGVASLDSAGKVPVAEIPILYSAHSISTEVSGSVSDQDYFLMRLWRQKIRIDGLSAKTSSGTCQVQITIDGTGVGDTHSISSGGQDLVIDPIIEIDGVVSSKRIGINVTSTSGASDLQVAIAVASSVI